MSSDRIIALIPIIVLLIAVLAAFVQYRHASKIPATNVTQESPVWVFWRTTIYGTVVAILVGTVTLSLRLIQVQEAVQSTSGALGKIEMLDTFSSLLRANDRALHGSPFLLKLLSDRQRDFQRVVQQAEDGRIYINPDELKSAALSLIGSSSTSIEATSYVSPESWWGTAWGKRYLADNAEAVKRKVRVERTFIFLDEAEMQRWEPFLRANHEAGVIVRFDFSSQLSQPFTRDVIKIDNKFVGVLELDGRAVSRVYFSSNDDDMQMVNRVLRIAGSATLYTPKEGSPEE